MGKNDNLHNIYDLNIFYILSKFEKIANHIDFADLGVSNILNSFYLRFKPNNFNNSNNPKDFDSCSGFGNFDDIGSFKELYHFYNTYIVNWINEYHNIKNYHSNNIHYISY